LIAAVGYTVVKAFVPAENFYTSAQKWPLSDD